MTADERRRLRAFRARETMHARSVRWHLKRGGDIAEAAKALAWLMQARTAREELEYAIKVRGEHLKGGK